MLGLFDGENQTHGGGVVVVGSVDVSRAVGLEEVLVAGSYVGHTLFRVGFIAKVRGWCAPEPVGFVTTPAIGEGRDMALGL